MDQFPSPSIKDDDIDYAYYESLQQSAKDGISAHPYDYYEMEDGDFEDHYFDNEPPDACTQLEFLWEDCTLPIIQQSITTAAPLTFLSLMLPLLGFLLVGGRRGARSDEQHDDVGDDSSPFLHLTSAGLGLAAIVVFFPDSWRVLTTIVLVSASLFQFLPKLSTSASQHLALYLSAFLWTAATYLELKMDGPTWHKLRGPALLVAMKALSVAIDEEKPSWEQLLGYLLCPGTVVFGPWIKYSDYTTLIEGYGRGNRRGWKPLISRVTSLLFSVAASILALFLSVCIASVFLTQIEPPTALPNIVVTWLATYRDALSFRTSHYYVCFTSRAMLIAIGAGLEEEEEEKEEEDEKKHDKVKCHDKTASLATGPPRSKKRNAILEITNPLNVELPRSLVEVVIHWNLPMHRWLKSYIFRPCRPVAGAPLAIFATYAISALLHGLNFQLAAVLFSLGLYSYAEHALRSKLARIFDACILARACRNRESGGDDNDDVDVCRQHAHKKNVIWVKLTNFCFGFIAMFHLAYLGVGFDNGEEQSRGYSMDHVLGKWSELGYASHILAFAFGGFSLLI